VFGLPLSVTLSFGQRSDIVPVMTTMVLITGLSSTILLTVLHRHRLAVFCSVLMAMIVCVISSDADFSVAVCYKDGHDSVVVGQLWARPSYWVRDVAVLSALVVPRACCPFTVCKLVPDWTSNSCNISII